MAKSSRVMAVRVDDNVRGDAAADVFFEVSDVALTESVNGWEDVAAKPDMPTGEASASLARAIDALKPLAGRIVEDLRALGKAAPGEIEISFGIKLSAKVGFFVAESQGESSIGLKLKWMEG